MKSWRNGVLSVFLVAFGSQAFAVDRLVPSEYPTIQQAIDASSNGDVVIISPDTYIGTGNKGIDLHGKAITVRSTDPCDPNVVAATVIDCQGSGRGFYFHSSEDPNSVVAGLTIRNGSALDGAGIFCASGSPTIAYCKLSNNGCPAPNPFYGLDRGGGGISISTGSSPIIDRCEITANVATAGGGINCKGNGTTISNCRITGNRAYGSNNIYGGGGLYLSGQDAEISHCTISGNIVGGSGGMYDGSGAAICCVAGAGTATDCLISGNIDDGGDGGFIIFCYGGALVFRNCTITGNRNAMFGALPCLGVYTGSTTIADSILWNPGIDEVMVWANSDLTVQYSDVRGGTSEIDVEPNSTLNWGPGMIAVDPLFVDPNGPDGNPNTPGDNDFHLSPNSPCINAGDPNGEYGGRVDIDGDPRIAGGRVDMGADEYCPYYTLTIGIFNDFHGQVLVDPCSPNCVYPWGAHVRLNAIPSQGKLFNEWEVSDPNHPGDGNYSVYDSNNPITIVMDANREVWAHFECGSGVAPLAPVMLGVLGLSLLVRRRW